VLGGINLRVRFEALDASPYVLRQG
jgi:hypothetical protein